LVSAQCVIALEALGEEAGPHLFAAITAQVQAMRQARGAVFMYHDPLCPSCARVLTPDEEQLVLCLRACRTGREWDAGRHALILCEGEPPTRFLDATERLAALLPTLAKPSFN
jgi:hypothetical protein